VVQIAATLLLATTFWWLIERPSTRLSQKIGRNADRRAGGHAHSPRPSPREPGEGDVAAAAFGQ
jgi:peptidoglycan/LPS O-acetylase OafA/YrhL